MAAALQPVLDTQNARLWFRYVAERQRVFWRYIRRDTPPWTLDSVVARGRMCNTHRFLDRQSLWLIAHVVRPLRARESLPDLLFNILIFRCFLNWDRSMQAVGLQNCEAFCASAFEAALRTAQERLGKLSNAAYNVGSFGAFKSDAASGPGCKPTRAAAMFAALAPRMHAMAEAMRAHSNSQHTYRLVRALPGLGPFTAYQACVDLGYAHPELYSESEHVVIGPGCRRGLQWLFRERGALSETDCVRFLQQVQLSEFRKAGIDEDELERLFGPPPPAVAPARLPSTPRLPKVRCASWGNDLGELHPAVPAAAAQSSEVGAGRASAPCESMAMPQQHYPLNLMAIENCLCEGDKYLRCIHGKGRFKQKFSPASAEGASGSYLDDLSIALGTLAATWNRESCRQGNAVRDHLPSLHLYVRDVLDNDTLQRPCAPAPVSVTASGTACKISETCTHASSCTPRMEKRPRLS